MRGASAPPAKGSGAYQVNNTAANVASMRQAYATLLNTSIANIKVERDFSVSGGERYRISFIGALDKTNIRDGMIAFNTSLDYDLVQDGVAAVAEIQEIKVDRAASTAGSFRLALNHFSTSRQVFFAVWSEVLGHAAGQWLQ